MKHGLTHTTHTKTQTNKQKQTHQQHIPTINMKKAHTKYKRGHDETTKKLNKTLINKHTKTTQHTNTTHHNNNNNNNNTKNTHNNNTQIHKPIQTQPEQTQNPNKKTNTSTHKTKIQDKTNTNTTL